MTQIKYGISFYKIEGVYLMSITDTQIYVALLVALFAGFMALRLSLELYK